jgi:hypothetical protein
MLPTDQDENVTGDVSKRATLKSNTEIKEEHPASK